MVVETVESTCEEVSKRKHGDGTLLDVEFSDGDLNSVTGVSSKRAKVSRATRSVDEEEEDDSDWEQTMIPVESEWEARAEPQGTTVNAASDEEEDAPSPRVAPLPSDELAFNFSYSGNRSIVDDKEACAELFRLFRVDPSRDVPPPLDDDTVGSDDLYEEYALSFARSIASVNMMVDEYERALRTARAERDEQRNELEEMASLRRELEEERAKVGAMRLEKKRMKKEAKVLKSQVKRLSKSQTHFVAKEKMYNELVAKSASRFDQMRKYVNEQPTFGSIALQLNQISGVFYPADPETPADDSIGRLPSAGDDDEHEI